MKKIAIIGAGLGGLSSAALLAKDGYDVTVYEKNSMPGGRATIFEHEGYRFDMGPSWYLMPDAFEKFFCEFGKKPSDYYKLIRLDPSYKVYFSDSESVIVKSDIEYMANVFEKMEKGAGNDFMIHMKAMKEKYEIGISKYLLKDYRSLLDLIEPEVIRNPLKLEFLETYHHSIAKKFHDERIQKILEFMVVFLGGSPFKVPGLYNLINWADFGLHVYYPDGGYYEVSKGFEKLAKEQGAKISYNSSVTQIVVDNGIAKSIIVNGKQIEADIVVANADMPFVESNLLDKKYTEHTPDYWKKSDLAPSSLCIFLGVKGIIPNLEHHTLVFSDGWRAHFQSVDDVTEPTKPQYYISTPSKTDPSVAPEGCENVFILVPLAAGIADSDELRKRLYDFVLTDLEKKVEYPIRDNIVYKKMIGVKDFENIHNAYKGNAFGLGHTMKHSAIFRPKNYSSKVRNLFFAGHFTNPGTGTPLVVLSGLIVRNIIRKLKSDGQI